MGVTCFHYVPKHLWETWTVFFLQPWVRSENNQAELVSRWPSRKYLKQIWSIKNMAATERGLYVTQENFGNPLLWNQSSALK